MGEYLRTSELNGRPQIFFVSLIFPPPTLLLTRRCGRKLASDDEFNLYGVAIFRKVRDDFAQKCREHKSVPLPPLLLPSLLILMDDRFVIRDFTYDIELIEKQKNDLIALEAEEKELWTELLRLSRINFSECFMVLVHLKVVRAFVESVLRYGLPAAYFLTVIKVRPSLPPSYTLLTGRNGTAASTQIRSPTFIRPFIPFPNPFPLSKKGQESR